MLWLWPRLRCWLTSPGRSRTQHVPVYRPLDRPKGVGGNGVAATFEEEPKMPKGGMKRRPWRFVAYRDARKEWRWRLLASNGRIVADSGEGYKRRQDMNRMIRKMKESLFEATVEEGDA